MKRYYEILGVGRDTPLDEVRQAYRDLVRVWHPDRFSSDYRLSRLSEEKLKLINEAYREVRAHIGSNPPPEQGALFEARSPANGSASPGDGEYMFDFYDPDYSPWIWTYQRERGPGPATATARTRSPRVAFLVAGICILGLSGAAAAWRFGLIPAAHRVAPSLPPRVPAAAAPAVPAPPVEIPAAPAVPVPASPGIAAPPSSPAPAGAPVAPEIGEARLRVGASPLGPGIRKGRSRVTMENDTGDDAVVKLVLVGTQGPQMVRSVFLPAGKTFTSTDVPPGRYLVKVALGAEWEIRAMRFRYPAGFAVSSGVEVVEVETDRPRADGIVVRQLVASELRIPLTRVLGTRLPEEEFLAD